MLRSVVLAPIAIWHDTVRKLAVVFFPLVGLLLVTGHELIPFLFTERYAPSVPIFMIWTTIILIVPLQADGVLGVYADTRSLAALYAIQLLLNAGLVIALMRLFGLIGAVMATGLSMGFGKTLVLIRAKRHMGVAFAAVLPWRSLAEVLGATAASALAALELKTHLAAAPLPLLLVTAGAFVATYLGIVAVRGLLDAETVQATTERIRLLLGWSVRAS